MRQPLAGHLYLLVPKLIVAFIPLYSASCTTKWSHMGGNKIYWDSKIYFICPLSGSLVLTLPFCHLTLGNAISEFFSLLAKSRGRFTKTHIAAWHEFKGNHFCCCSWISVSSPMCLREEWCLTAKFNLGVLWLFPFERTSWYSFLRSKTHQLSAYNPTHCWKWKPFVCLVSPKAAYQQLISLIGTYLKDSTAPFICMIHWGFCVHSDVTLMYMNKYPLPTRKVTQCVFGAADSALPLLWACANIIWSHSALHLLYI